MLALADVWQIDFLAKPARRVLRRRAPAEPHRRLGRREMADRAALRALQGRGRGGEQGDSPPAGMLRRILDNLPSINLPPLIELVLAFP